MEDERQGEKSAKDVNDERQGKKSADAKHRSRDIEPADSLNPAGLKEESQKKYCRPNR